MGSKSAVCLCVCLAETGWTPLMEGAYKATFVFGYVVAAMFVVHFLVLVTAPSEFVGETQAPRTPSAQACWGRARGGLCDPIFLLPTSPPLEGGE